MEYPVHLSKDDNGTVLVEFVDIPEAVTFGDTKEEALARATDALATAVAGYIKDRRPLPVPSRATGPLVEVPLMMALKVVLYQTMQQLRIGKAELARRLHWHLPQVDRLLDVRHASRLDQLEAGLGALGKRVTLSVEDALPVRSRGEKRKLSVSRRRMRKAEAPSAETSRFGG
jgi:antitoxin HicB